MGFHQSVTNFIVDVEQPWCKPRRFFVWKPDGILKRDDIMHVVVEVDILFT
jgi:hypothetical protein